MKDYTYQNNLIGKKQLRQLLAWSFTNYDSMQACFLADELKYLGFKYATQAGISISIEDLKIPFVKNLMLEKANQEIIDSEKIYLKGKITDIERFQKIIDTWSLTSESLKDQVIHYFKNYDPLNSVYIMAFSGARGNLSQVRQLVGMRGLMSDPSGEIMKLPIKKNFREGLTITDYLMSGYGARKGIVDTALKTANSGYLTRRLIDVAQDILIREKDCLTTHSFLIVLDKNDEKILGRIINKPIIDPETGNLIANTNTQITPNLIQELKQRKIQNLYIRSPLTCTLYRAICQKCYGWDLANENLVDIGEAIGILAGQSIGEPGTQLTMRTFHTGWVAKDWWDITQGLTRVEELLEARAPKSEAIISEFAWVVTDIKHNNSETEVIVTANELHIVEQCIDNVSFNYTIKTWDTIKHKQIIARSKQWNGRVNAIAWWIVDKIDNWVVYIKDIEKKEITYTIPSTKTVLVNIWDELKAWDKLIEWHINLQKLMWVASVLDAELYVVNDIKSIYTAQWQTVNSKHIEVIVRQMFSKIKILDSWATKFFPWDIADVIDFQKENRKMNEEWVKQALWQRLLLWLTKTSLYTDSWLSAASFQETVRVLVEASVSKKVDVLEWLKENVIIWRLIPTLDYFNNNIETD